MHVNNNVNDIASLPSTINNAIVNFSNSSTLRDRILALVPTTAQVNSLIDSKLLSNGLTPSTQLNNRIQSIAAPLIISAFTSSQFNVAVQSVVTPNVYTKTQTNAAINDAINTYGNSRTLQSLIRSVIERDLSNSRSNIYRAVQGIVLNAVRSIR